MEQYEVAIIGGGISGLYCAKKLRDNGVDGIIVLEKSDRWGGRLNTDLVEINNRIIKEEKGAMRFNYRDPDSTPKSSMPILSRLIKDMDMTSQVEPFHMAPQPKPNSSLTEVKNYNSNYFSGQHFTSSYADQNPLIWNALLDSGEEFESLENVFEGVYQKLVRHNKDKVRKHFDCRGQGDDVGICLKQDDFQTLQQYEDEDYWKFFRNQFDWPVESQQTKLKDITILNLLKSMGYSDVFRDMLVRVFLDSDNSTCAAGSVLSTYLILIRDSDNDLFQFKNGWTSLVDAIRSDMMTEKSNVELLKNCDVDAIYEDGEGFILRTSIRGLKIRAKHLVMAIPPCAIKNLIRHCSSESILPDVFNPLMKICNSIVSVESTKIILYFNNDWWNRYNEIILLGPNSTDLTCHSVYPLYDECRRCCKGCDNCDSDSNPSALLIYCDATRSAAWRNYQNTGRRFESPLQTEYSHLTPASVPLVAEALGQLKKVFHTNDIPHPILTSYRNWNGQGDYGYAYSYWALGAEDQDINAPQPIEGKNLYLCSDAWSSSPGWVEGSLMATEKVINKIVNDI